MIDYDFISEEDFIMYLLNEGVTVYKDTSDRFNLRSFLPGDNDIKNQLKLIKKFHNAAKGYSGNSYFKLKDENGKQIEEMKVGIKQFNRDMKKLQNKEKLNLFEKSLMNSADKYLELNDKCMSNLKSIDYNKIIERSMRNREICLGNAYFDNLFYINNGSQKNVKIFDIKKCCYNCLEIDGVKFIRRLNKKGLSYTNKIIEEYCSMEGLDNDSNVLMNILIMYPGDIIKLWRRYKYNKKVWNDNEYCERLNSIILKDNRKIINEKEVEQCRI